MEQQERNGVNEARYAALELLEAELRDGNRAHAELAREELAALRAAGTLPRSFGEVRAFCGPRAAVATVFALDAYGAPIVPVLGDEDALAAGESGLWGLVELPDDPRAMVS